MTLKGEGANGHDANFSMNFKPSYRPAYMYICHCLQLSLDRIISYFCHDAHVYLPLSSSPGMTIS